MRSSSNGRRAIAVLACASVAWPGGPALGAAPPAPALLLKFAAPGVPDSIARARLEPMERLLARRLNVSWVPIPSASPRPDAHEVLPEAGAADLAAIARALADAAGRMDAMETEGAARALDEAEALARRRRPDPPLRPYLAEVFFRRGLLRVWEGNAAAAEEHFVRARALRPDFSPDPALFSPAVRAAWARAAARPAPGADVVIRTFPPGADVEADGETRGVTPLRLRVPVLAPVRIRVALPGYIPAERAGTWLPGDSEMIDLTLRRDPAARLAELLAAAPAGGPEAGAILTALAAEGGAERIGLLVLAEAATGHVVRVASMDRDAPEPSLLGEFPWPEEGAGTDEVAARSASLLAAAGWPEAPASRGPGTPWYHRWWVWALLGLAAAAVAAGAGGGGGSGGSSGTIGINF